MPDDIPSIPTTLKNDNVYDEPMYIGRLEVVLNNGKKRKYIYFQSDYKIKE